MKVLGDEAYGKQRGLNLLVTINDAFHLKVQQRACVQRNTAHLKGDCTSKLELMGNFIGG